MNISKLLSTRVRNIKINPFLEDLTSQKNFLHSQINDKKILVIGGAGTIGSSYIKQILKYKPSKITVVDINENGLTELTRDLRSSNLLDYNPEYITYPVNLLSTHLIKYLIQILGMLFQIFQPINMYVQKKIKFLLKL